MRAEEFLQMHFDFWPELFYSRENLLDYLLGVVGNGYEWENGELTNHGGDERLNRYTFKYHIEKAVPSLLSIHLHEDKMTMYNRHIEILKAKGKEPNPDYLPRYGRSLAKGFSLLYEVPDDIKPDYLALVEEYKGYLKAHGVEF